MEQHDDTELKAPVHPHGHVIFGGGFGQRLPLA